MPTRTLRSGNKSFRSAIRKALRAQGINSIRAGFFASAKYPTGTQVAAVAAWLEFGTAGREPRRGGWGGPIPERPYFRAALRTVRSDVLALVREELDADTLRVDSGLADRIGAMVAGAIQSSITDGDWKENSELTKKLKGPSKTKPLVDTGQLRQSVSWAVDK